MEARSVSEVERRIYLAYASGYYPRRLRANQSAMVGQAEVPPP